MRNFLLSILLLVLTCGAGVGVAGAQSFTTTDATTVQPVVNPMAKVSNNDQFNTPILKNGLNLNPGFEKPLIAIMTQVGSSSLGSQTYFVDSNAFAIVPANEAVGITPDLGIAQVWRPGSGIICTAPINGNNAGDSNAAVFTAVLSGTSLNSFTPASASITGIANGTYPLRVSGGSGSGGAANMVVTGATLGAGGYTGGTATPVVTVAGSYTSAPKINIWNGYTIGACTSGTWTGGATVGDYVDVRYGYGATTKAQFNAMGWGTSGSGTIIGSTDVPSSTLLPPGMQDGQSIQVTGPIVLQAEFDTGSPGGQNLYPMVAPLQTELDAKQTVGSGPITWTIRRLTTAGFSSGFSCNGTISPSGSWQHFSNFASSCVTGETEGGGPSSAPTGPIQVLFSIPNGSTILLDNALVGSTSTNPTQYRDSFVTASTTYGGGDRSLDNQMPDTLTDTIQPDIRGVHPYYFGDNCNNGQPLWSAGCIKAPAISLKMHQDLCVALGTDCWDVIGIALSPTDAQTLADFEGGSCTAGYPTCTCGTTGATLRCGMNHATPYTTLFGSQSPKRVMHLELGNENWNLASAGGKWLPVPQCSPVGANCSAAFNSGVNTQYPYGSYTQIFASNFEGRGSYDNTTEVINFGAQMSGNNTTFALDNLFKPGGTSTPGTPFVTAAVDIDYAPYIDFIPTQTGFNTGNPSNQLLSDYANVFWNMDNVNGLIHIPVLAYPNPADFYEVNGGQTSQGFSTTITQAMESGYQNGVGEGLALVVSAMEACKTLGVCKFQSFFVTQQQNKTFTPTVKPTFTGTITSGGGNHITGVTITPQMAVGQTISGPGLALTPPFTGSAIIWGIDSVAGTLTISTNVSCSTCGSGTYTIQNLVTNLWGCFVGIGAQTNNNIRAQCLAYEVLNNAIPYGSSMTQTVAGSVTTKPFPPTGTCGTGSTAGNAGSCNQAYGQTPTPNTLNIPQLYGWSFKGAASGPIPTFRSHVYLNEDTIAHTVSIIGSPIAGQTVTQITIGVGNATTDTNENVTPSVVPVTSSVTMPTSFTLAPNSMVVLFGNIGAPAAPAPTFSPIGGTYGSTQTVTISDAASSPTIYYTIDGSTPTTSSTVYTGPLTIATTTLVKAIATASGFTQSPVATALYTITTPPTTNIQLRNGQYKGKIQFQ